MYPSLDSGLVIAFKVFFVKVMRLRKTKKLRETSKENLWKSNQNIDFGGARQKRMAPSNSTQKLPYVDLVSSLYNHNWTKTLSLHVCKHSWLRMYNFLAPKFFWGGVKVGSRGQKVLWRQKIAGTNERTTTTTTTTNDHERRQRRRRQRTMHYAGTNCK